MWLRQLLAFGMALALAAGLTLEAADDATRTRPSPGTHQPGAGLPPFTPQREAAALRFVEQHHPELGQVLAKLEKLNRDQYQQAIREIFQQAQRLAAARNRDETLYELMLETWKVNSRIELLAAQIASAREKDAKLEAELKGLLQQQVRLQIQQIEHQRQRALAMVKMLEANLKMLEEKQDEIVERRFGVLTHKRQGSGDRSQEPKN